MKVAATKLPGVMLIEPVAHNDERGFFVETYHIDRYREAVGIEAPFVQDNHSHSRRNVLRGLHAQKRHPQGKLVRAVHGTIFDVAVDINPRSLTFGLWDGAILSGENQRQLWIPPGYAHGFVVLSEKADVEYKCTALYAPGDEIGLIWNDPEVGIEWPVADPVLSRKDSLLPPLDVLKRTL